LALRARAAGPSEPGGIDEFDESIRTATGDLLRPAGLAGLIARLLADGPPDEPVIVAG